MSDAIIQALCDRLDENRAEFEHMTHDRNRYRKEARKLQDQLNRYNNLIPGTSRLLNGDRIVMEMHAEAETMRETGDLNQDPDGLDRDALWLDRLVYDLITLREAMDRPVRGTRNRKYDPAQWPRGPRP